MTDFIFTLLGAALVNNLILGLPLGADSLRQSRSRALALAGGALIAVATPIAWLLDQFILVPLELGALRLFIFLPLLAPLAWLCLEGVGRACPSLPREGLWPLLLANGAALGAMLIGSESGFGVAIGLGLGGGLGFWLVLTLLDDLLQQVDETKVPAAFRGTPLLLVCAGLMGLAFLGFNGMGAQ
ncbi:MULTISPECIES: Rnf-Nqr domain containing protein [unclassified Pseudomonas]|uniref:Rnf-Nqr domain containing protein n=1 Tax=unclassified Pseudomonas TaxID=196821 RepID=UPI00129EBB2E|nr:MULTISPECIES: Rnf-Nqr domain containing protein [unclassified Pseudomonas]MDH4654920.1 electron transporter RnfA [Pseudomonas sp. BN606]MRK19411.1 electron transporter RnfA [Pseudomonas sp. JG-B]